ncbi:MAG: transglutaminase domain-containing protein [Ignavibacteriae bacterium]|nr:MAG: transglutaminase domain-containing protein [Ignavibacteriota bacterium]
MLQHTSLFYIPLYKLDLHKFFILIIASLFFICLTGCTKNLRVSKDETERGRIHETVISYMSQPGFANKDFTQQITGTNANLQVYNVDEGDLYFSIKKSDFDSTSTINSLTVNPANVQYGFKGEDRIIIGKYSFKGSDMLFFRFPKNDLRIDTTKIISIDYGKYKYTLSLNELADFSDDKTVYGGKLDAAAGKNVYMANHGSLVGIKDEPSLKRFAQQITGSETNREKIAQMLLDFVINNIQYNVHEGMGVYEVLKRPNEVLMSGNSDCSGLTILYASLLEQYGIEYRLVYMQHHICLGIEGSFLKTNNLDFEYEGKTFSVAETTAKGFRIGTTRLVNGFSTDEIIFIQKPGKDGEMIRFKERTNLTEEN